MPDNFRHAQYDDNAIQIDDPQRIRALTETQVVLTQNLVSGVNNITDLIAPGLLSGVVYDSNNRAIAWTIDDVNYSASYTSAGITIAGSDGTTTRIGVDPAQRITSVGVS